ncbi:MAG: type I 3-dehydroquinate dehydratase [Caldimicrobium sp.]|nr:type I 3-dehydroquinate dehydratase [Caldimicrobium sp.]
MFCLSVGEKTWSKTLEVVKKNAHPSLHSGQRLTHLFEIRLDYLEDDLSPESISFFILSCRANSLPPTLSCPPSTLSCRAERGIPHSVRDGAPSLKFIFTCRLPEEGGKRHVPEEERLKILKHCLEMGAYLVDLEWKALQRFIKKHGNPPFPLDRTLVSFHDFHGTPNDRALKGLMKSLSQASVKLAKVVCFSEKPEDGLRLLSLIPYGRRLGIEVVAFGMGEKLSWTRIVSLILGAPFTYVSASKDAGTAPGQLDIISAKSLYEGLTSCLRSTE